MHWLDNHALAEAECKTGWLYEEAVATRLRASGLPVSAPPKIWRSSVHEATAGAYTNEIDLVVNGLRLSVKSRRLAFTDDPASIPRSHDPLFVDTVRKWTALEPEPFAVVCVSQLQLTDDVPGMVWLPADVDAWTTRTVYDAKRGYSDQFFAAPIRLWQSFETLPPALMHYYDGDWWLSTAVMTGGVTVRTNIITAHNCTPIFRRFIGQPFINLVAWLRRLPGPLVTARS